MENTYKITIEYEVSVTDEEIDDIMVCALEGGINYWCDDCEVVGDYLGEFASDQISRGGKLKLRMDDPFERGTNGEWIEDYELDKEKFLKGLKTVLATHNNLIEDGRLCLWDIDADIADQIIQSALFGEIVFG